MSASQASIGQPLFFNPIMVERVWGANRLQALFGKDQSKGQIIGESWEICDRPDAQSIVTGGDFDGWTLRRLMEERTEALLGPQLASRKPPHFPLLIKYVDAGKPLSVQVHPDDAGAARLGIPDRGKCECWYIVDAAPGSKIVRGLKEGVTREAFQKAIEENAVETLLHAFEPKSGDVIAIPPGMLHAIGGGIVIAEIQQNSDITFRVYDYGRVGLDGKPRQLHISESLDSIRFDKQFGTYIAGDMHVDCVQGQAHATGRSTITDYLTGMYFDLRSVSARQDQVAELPLAKNAPTVFCCVGGKGKLGDRSISAGLSALLPADLDPRSAQLIATGDTPLKCLLSTPTPEA